MSLLKQLFLAICLFLVVAFTGSFIASVETSREQLLSQLRSHAQDAATALGLSMTPHVDDPAMIELMVSSIFDSGYFATIRVVRIPSDEVIVERRTTTTSDRVPQWFVDLVDLEPEGGDALVQPRPAHPAGTAGQRERTLHRQPPLHRGALHRRVLHVSRHLRHGRAVEETERRSTGRSCSPHRSEERGPPAGNEVVPAKTLPGLAGQLSGVVTLDHHGTETFR